MLRRLIAIAPLLTAFAVAEPAVAQSPPACSAGVPQALGFDGLRTRVYYGPPQVFTLTEDDGDWTSRSDATVEMESLESRRIFFRGRVEADEELFVQLDLDDGPVEIRATYVQRHETAEENGDAPPGSTTCTQRLTRTVRGERRILLPRQCLEGNYRPGSFVIACGDGNYQVRALQWRRWNRNIARGSGVAWANDCIPFCFNGTFHKYRVKVRVSRIRRCDADGQRYRYTRFRLTFTGDRPPGARRTQTHRVVCVDPETGLSR
jgi:hypothetical protein